VKIALTQQRSIAVLPETRIAQGDGVKISHPVSGYELRLGSNVDCVVIEYENVMDNKGESGYQRSSFHGLLHDLLRPLSRPRMAQSAVESNRKSRKDR
jgi:hypothetical protein